MILKKHFFTSFYALHLKGMGAVSEVKLEDLMRYNDLRDP